MKRKASDIEDIDQPVLSHAELRKRRKKEKQGDDNQEPDNNTRKSGHKTKSEQALTRQNSVWVGNLAFKTTPVSLKAFFDGVGEITRINMPMKAANGKGPKENSGFAYVDFATKDAKGVAMTMSEKNLEGRRLLIKDGDDYSTKPGGPPKGDGASGISKTGQKILNAQKQPAGPTLFFGNLSFQTTDQSIRQLLEAHRPQKAKKSAEDDYQDEHAEDDDNAVVTGKDSWIRKIRLGTFEDTGVCKGWAFVDFTSVENATAALVNPRNHTLDGRKLNVEYASPDAVRRGGGPGERKHVRKKEQHGTTEKQGSEPRPHRFQHKEAHKELDNSGVLSGNTEMEGFVAEKPTDQKPFPRHRSNNVSSKRLKPGAALAQAQRATSAAIVPSQGKKIVF